MSMTTTITVKAETHYRWAVITNTEKGWAIQPSRRTRVGTQYGPPVAWFRTKAAARAAMREMAHAPAPKDFDWKSYRDAQKEESTAL